jgi:hypothetical protein
MSTDEKPPYRMEKADTAAPAIAGLPSLEEIKEEDAISSKLPQLMERLGLPAGATMSHPTKYLQARDGRFWDIFLIAHRVIDLLEQALVRGVTAMKQTAEVSQAMRQQEQIVLQLAVRVTELEALVPGAKPLIDRINKD